MRMTGKKISAEISIWWDISRCLNIEALIHPNFASRTLEKVPFCP
jgi:hypothetical protein